MEDKKSFRRILQLEGRQDAAPAVGATTDNTAMPFAIYNWLGFLSSVKVLDTTILPPVKIYIRLASAAVLTKHADITTPTFDLSEVFASVDIMDVADGLYYNGVQSRLASSPIEIPFDSYQTVIGSLGQVTQSTRWSTSTDCLEGIIATFKTATPTSGTHNNITKLSEYFTRPSQTLTTSQFKVNGLGYPSSPCETKYGEQFVQTAHSLGVSQDVLGATDSGMISHAVWLQNYFVHAVSFTYPDGDDSHRLVGLSGRQNQLLGSWDNNGSGANIQPLLWLKCKSVLRVGANRFVEVIQ